MRYQRWERCSVITFVMLLCAHLHDLPILLACLASLSVTHSRSRSKTHSGDLKENGVYLYLRTMALRG